MEFLDLEDPRFSFADAISAKMCSEGVYYVIVGGCTMMYHDVPCVERLAAGTLLLNSHCLH